MARIGTIVVVGGGLAAGKALEALRDAGFDGRVVLVAQEQHLPYERPPLSKGYLLGDQELDSTFVHADAWYDEHGIDLRLGITATAVDVERHTVTVGEEDLGYDRLLIATGASVRRLPAAHESDAPVSYLRTIEDSVRIKAGLLPARRVTVIGGGWIGLEVAAAARTAGCEVAVVETLELPLVRVLGPEVARVFAELHRSHGVDLRTNASISAVESDADAAVVHLDDGSTLESDLIVVGVGVTPNAGLAETAGLEMENGVVVDEWLRSSHPDVFAAGDVANAYHPRLERHLRVEHWDNAIEQGITAARNMVGAEQPYDRLPYFFTDQYDLGMEYVGSVGPDGYDEVVLRGDVPGGVFTAFWLKGGKVLAGMHANDWDATDAVRGIVDARQVDLAGLRDHDVPLDDLTD
ncbi:MAG TPA: FAD-dependent oxidoreductase [Nocardioidaceae bacterium]|nr:FAD-dependent oxidoreductase [Nocardioidaceae bacterium]